MELKMEVAQTLALSQRMIQSAEILQMSSQELETYLKEMAVENPVIDIEEHYEAPKSAEDLQRKLEWLASSDEQNRVYYSEEYSGDDDSKQDMWNVTDHRGEDLATYLESQLMAVSLPEPERKLTNYLIDLLDGRGYLAENTADIAAQLKVPEPVILECLKRIQTFDPAGVGARNLSECLMLQLDRNRIDDPVVRQIVEHYLPQLGKNQLPQIAKKLGITIEDVCSAMERIRTLNPKPGNSFSSRENLKYITPDVTVVRLKDYFEILLNDYMYPRLGINGYYRQILGEADKQTKEYIGNKIRQAEWVQQCVAQRGTTLMNVSRCIVDRQEQFFLNGPGYLKPLKLSDVAGIVGIHESTVSRAVKDKYLQCSWGIFPMNYFFVTALAKKSSGENASSDRAKSLLKEIIEAENHEKPYSDRILAEMITEKGVKISRRTVTKYREAMGIKDASGRKVYQ